MWLKICGVTRAEDAEAAVQAGASAVGFVFWNRSRRCVTTRQAREIGERLPPAVERAGVFVDACREEIVRVVDEAGLTWCQLHGEEDLDLARSLGVPWVKAHRVGAGGMPPGFDDLVREAHGRRFMLDTFVAGTPGGTGRTFDWSAASPYRDAAAPLGGAMILAGGLTPENVARAVAGARPFGVDVSGGVESAPGIKDLEKIRRFAAALGEAAP
ncbi:MAG TPA: phosphoribosylanthranilate isomerase [Verrucomicrobiae bacterium]|nr:phosphoribosylanthranilate isomerase [Verrucomicrobiae bacterium]